MNDVMQAGFLGGLGMPELLVIAGVAIVLFGGKKVGELGKGLGDAIKGFKSAIREGDEAQQMMQDDWEKDPAWKSLRDKRDWSGLAEYEKRHRV